MKITKIVQQEKVKGRYSLFVDGTYAFSLSENALLASKLTVGEELTKDDLKHWKQQSADDKIYSAALKYAAIRLRSTWEMEQYLKRKLASPTLASKILNKLSDVALIDDRKFAESWVSTRRLLRPTSRRKLQQELRAKHVPDEVIDVTLSSEQTNDEQAALQQIIAKKRRLPKYQADPAKLMNYLARQGFSYQDIKSALKVDDSDS